MTTDQSVHVGMEVDRGAEGWITAIIPGRIGFPAAATIHLT